MRDSDWISEKILEVMIYLAAFWASGELAQTIYRWTFNGNREEYSMGLLGLQPLVYYVVRGALAALVVQAAARKLTDAERARNEGKISWFEPWRIAQAVVLASLIISWAYWAASQMPEKTAKATIQPAHPGIIAITGLAVISCLGLPALFRLMEPGADRDEQE